LTNRNNYYIVVTTLMHWPSVKFGQWIRAMCPNRQNEKK
jgi:hypothetical protein